MITINMEKAREIHRNRLRIAREPLFTQLDIEFQRALEQGADTQDIVAKKQALRDITNDPTIAIARTLDELKSIWPEILKS
jgi:hypothetical protein